MKLSNLIKAGIAAGIIIWVIAFIVDLVIQTVLPFDVFDIGGMREVTDPLILLFFLHPFVLSFAMTYAYPYFSKSMKGDDITKGKKFGMLMWLIIALPSAFLVYTSMTYPLGFTINSIIAPFFYFVASGIIIAKMEK